MIDKKGFSLLELLITMAIMVVVLALTGPVYTRILTGVKDEAVSAAVYQDIIGSLDLIRLDLEHIGHGVGRDESSMPIIWDEANQTLEIRSALNNTNETTMGWGLLNCATGNNFIVDELVTATAGTGLILLDEAKIFKSLSTYGAACPAGYLGIYTVYPYDTAGTNSCAGGGWCTRITYRLSVLANPAPASKSACAENTFNFIRQVGDGAGDTIINCVADFRVRFDIDNDATGTITAGEEELDAVPTIPVAFPEPAGDLMDSVKNIELYVLVQAGRLDTDLNTNPNTTVGSVNPFTLSSAAVVNANNYRWKVIKVSGKPMSW